MTRRTRDVLAALVAWHDARPRAALPTSRGWLWTALIAATFFWMSNPLVFIPSFYLSLGEALVWTKVVVVLSLPWLRLPRVPWPWVAFLGLGLLSQLWTINDFHTDVSNVVYLEITALAVIAAANCTHEVIAWGMGLGGAAVVTLSAVAYQQEVPGASNTAIGGAAFTGVGTNENILAYTLVVSLAAMLAVGRPRHLFGWAAWALVLGVNGLGLYLAGSGNGYLTTLVIALVAVATAAWPVLVRAPRHLHLAGTLTAALLLMLGLLFVALVLDLQLSTVSGRAPFWRAAVEASLDEAPFLGSGWGAVWSHPWNAAPVNDVLTDIYTRAGYPLSHGHNFFVDVMPELGLVGVVIVVAMVAYAVRAVRRSGLQPGSREPVAGRLVLLVLVALLVFGITEPMLTVPVGWWSLTLVVAAARQRGLPGTRRRSQQLVGARRRAEGPARVLGRKAGSNA